MNMFPIQFDDHIRTIPYAMVLEHADQMRINHGCTVDSKAVQGGMTPEEACAVLEDRSFEPMAPMGATLTLKRHVERWLGIPELSLVDLPSATPARPTHLFILTKSAETRRRLENIRDGRLMLSRGHMNEAITLLEELEHLVRGEA